MQSVIDFISTQYKREFPNYGDHENEAFFGNELMIVSAKESQQ